MEYSAQDPIMSSCLDRLRLYSQRTADNEEQIRNISSKILTKIKIHDTANKEIINKSLVHLHLSTFLAILQTSDDEVALGNMVLILQEFLDNKTTKRDCLTALHENNIIPTLFRSIPIITRDLYYPENILPAVFHIMCAVAKKDPKFPLKARTCGGLRIIMNVIKSNPRHSLLLRYLMHTMKILVQNATNTSALGKEGLVQSLITVLTFTGRRPTMVLKLTLETLGIITRNKSNVVRLVRHNGIPRLLIILEQWDKYESNRIKICRANLIVLSNVVDIPSGNKAIIESNGINILHKFCTALPISSEFEHLLLQSNAVLQKCLPSKSLPIPSSFGPFSFPLPKSNLSSRTTKTEHEVTGTTDEDVLEDEDSSTSNDDELQEADENEADKEQEAASSDSNNNQSANQLSKEELASYEIFFNELHFLDCRKVTVMSESILEKSNIGIPVNFKYGASQDDLIHKINDSSSSTHLHSKTSLCSKGSSEQKYTSELSTSCMLPEQLEKQGQILPDRIEELYCKLSNSTKHVVEFVKLAYPEMCCENMSLTTEPLNEMDFTYCRSKLLEYLNRYMSDDNSIGKIAFDLDALAEEPASKSNPGSTLQNDDILRIGKPDHNADHLKFESRFESGNLRKAIQTGPYEYELVLTPDINCTYHLQWFYFEVSNMKADIPYTFQIINCEKQNSQFNFGMKPLVYSVKEATLGRPGWVRSGNGIMYFRNQFLRNLEGTSETGSKNHFTTLFTIKFRHSYDVCYLAYHYPYSYTLLQTHISLWERNYNKDKIYFEKKELCKTLGGNTVPVLTITSKSISGLNNRPYIFLTARVHPGESNSSWVMKGSIDLLLSDKPAAQALRDLYIFKIVPMLNPDGVINGCHRCDLAAEDLNRCWSQPCPILHPSIFHTKALLQFLVSISKSPLVYCDYHGHSRRKNIFLYGCCNKQSWLEEDKLQPEDRDFEILPRLLQTTAPAFSLEHCSFAVEKSRESTARVTVWRELGIKRSYTMESSYCGCDQGPYKGLHIGISHLEEMGKKFVQALSHLHPVQSYNHSSYLNNISHEEIRVTSNTDGDLIEEEAPVFSEDDSDEEVENEDQLSPSK